MSKLAHVLYCQMRVKSEKCNCSFQIHLFYFLSNQSLSLHLKIVIKLQKNSKSVDMLKYKFHFKHLEYRPELHFSDLTLEIKQMDLKTTFDRSQVKVNEKDEFTTQMLTIKFPK
jgi:hypothetical protein